MQIEICVNPHCTGAKLQIKAEPRKRFGNYFSRLLQIGVLRICQPIGINLHSWEKGRALMGGRPHHSGKKAAPSWFTAAAKNIHSGRHEKPWRPPKLSAAAATNRFLLYNGFTAHRTALVQKY